MHDDTNPSRRCFIKTAAAASAWLVAPSALGQVVGANDRLNVAVIGTGGMGTNHVRGLTERGERDNVRVVRVCDLYRRRLNNAVEIIEGAPGSGTMEYREVLDDPEVDAVVIATPTCTHYALAKQALEAGKHVLCEKPLTERAGEAEELIAIAGKQKLVLMVGHVFLFNNGIMKLRELISEGALGRVQYLDAVRTNLGPVRGDVNALVDLGTHDHSHRDDSSTHGIEHRMIDEFIDLRVEPGVMHVSDDPDDRPPVWLATAHDAHALSKRIPPGEQVLR